MLRSQIVAFMLLLGLSGGVQAQDRQESMGPDSGPIATLIHMRAQLRLSEQQVTELRQLDEQTEARNRPFVARLHELRRRARALGHYSRLSPEARAQFDAYMQEGQPLLQSIHENNMTAMREVGHILSDKQKETMRELLQNANRDRERSRSIPPSNRRGQ